MSCLESLERPEAAPLESSSNTNPFADFRLPDRPHRDRLARLVTCGVWCLLAIVMALPLWVLFLLSSQVSGASESAGQVFQVEVPAPPDATVPLPEQEFRWSGSAVLVIVRRDRRPEAELRRELAAVPELQFERDIVTERRFDHVGLPVQSPPIQMESKTARRFEVMAQRMRGCLSVALQSNEKEKVVRENLESDPGWFAPESVGCLMQMLQPECRPIRQALVEQLQRIEGARATEALAKVAVFDLSGEVRADAIVALASRPADQYRSVLLAAFRHPWPAAADHAAEALVALRDEGAVPGLRELAEEIDPADTQTPKVRELVRLSHLKNCASCHIESKAAEEPLRGVVPTPGQPLPPLLEAYQGSNGPFVRADVTFLRQDFSTALPVAKADPWPSSQRFDFFVRTRQLLPGEQREAAAASPQRESARFALQWLAGK